MAEKVETVVQGGGHLQLLHVQMVVTLQHCVL